MSKRPPLLEAFSCCMRLVLFFNVLLACIVDVKRFKICGSALRFIGLIPLCVRDYGRIKE